MEIRNKKLLKMEKPAVILSLRSHLFLCVLVARLAISSSSSLQLRTNQAALYVFGDSFFDAGTNNYIDTSNSFKANFWPYGQTTFKYPTGRFSNGRLIPDFISEYAWLPVIPPYLQPGNQQFFSYGVNFASGGGGALSQTYSGFVIDLKTQLSQLKEVEKVLKEKLGDEETKKLFSRAVYLFNIGANDYVYASTVNTNVLETFQTEKEYAGKVVGSQIDVIKEIYKIGGRKFGVVGMGPLGCLPSVVIMNPVPETRGYSCDKRVNQLMKLHNQLLVPALINLQTQLQGFKHGVFDLYTSLSEIIKHPSKYGFKYGKTACCGSGPFRGNYTCGGKSGDGNEYVVCENADERVFYDSYHPTQKVYQILAELMWNGTRSIMAPYNLRSLFHHEQIF